MDIDISLLLKIGLGLLAFIVIVRFLFSVSNKENHLKRTSDQIRHDIDRLKKDIGALKDRIPPTEFGEVMDDLMEEYYGPQVPKEEQKKK